MSDSTPVGEGKVRRTYRAKMYDRRLGRARHGRLYLTDDEFVFVAADGGHVAVPLSGVCAQSMPFLPRRESAWRRRRPVKVLAWWVAGMAFRHRTRPYWLFHTRDLGIVQDRGWNAYPEEARRVRENRPRWVGLRKAVFWSALVFFALWILHPGFRETLSEPMVSVISPSVDVRMGERGYESLLRHHQVRLIGNRELLEPLERAFARLEAVLPVEERIFDADVYLAESSEVNAFVLPGGKVFVFTGLLIQAESEDEVAGVLAHEIAHAQKRHSLRKRIEQGVCDLLWALLIGDRDGWTDCAGYTVCGMSRLRFSRDAERDADLAAVRYMQAAGYDPEALSRMFERWSGESDEMLDWLVLLSTHPDPKERAMLVRTSAAEQAGTPRLSQVKEQAEWDAYRLRLTMHSRSRSEAQRNPGNPLR